MAGPETVLIPPPSPLQWQTPSTSCCSGKVNKQRPALSSWYVQSGQICERPRILSNGWIAWDEEGRQRS